MSVPLELEQQAVWVLGTALCKTIISEPSLQAPVVALSINCRACELFQSFMLTKEKGIKKKKKTL